MTHHYDDGLDDAALAELEAMGINVIRMTDVDPEGHCAEAERCYQAGDAAGVRAAMDAFDKSLKARGLRIMAEPPVTTCLPELLADAIAAGLPVDLLALPLDYDERTRPYAAAISRELARLAAEAARIGRARSA
jgi:hypothetical protein